MTKQEAKNRDFARSMIQFMRKYIPIGQAENLLAERLAQCYDAFPQTEMQDREQYQKWLSRDAKVLYCPTVCRSI